MGNLDIKITLSYLELSSLVVYLKQMLVFEPQEIDAKVIISQAQVLHLKLARKQLTKTQKSKPFKITLKYHLAFALLQMIKKLCEYDIALNGLLIRLNQKLI